MIFDTHISDDTDALRDSVKRMCDDELAPRAAQIDHDNAFPMDMWKKLGDLGLLGISIPEEFGGTGLGYLAHTVAMEEVSRASASVGLAYGAFEPVHIEQSTSTAAKRSATNTCRSPARRTRRRTGDVRTWRGIGCGRPRWLAVRRRKATATSPTATRCDHQRPARRYADRLHAHRRRDQGSRAMTAFIIEKGFKGFRTAQKLDKLGMRGSDTCELVFEDCEIPEENVLGEFNAGSRVLMRGLTPSAPCFPAGRLASCRRQWTSCCPICTSANNSTNPSALSA